MSAYFCVTCKKYVVLKLPTQQYQPVVCSVCNDTNIIAENLSIGKDHINPDHYKSHPSGIECIAITRHMNFNIGNVFKYLWRAGLKSKGATIEDHKKALWYLNDEIARLEKEEAAKALNSIEDRS